MIGKDRPEGWDVPPWELPGNFRLDCEPHRGPLVRWLANVGLLSALASFFPCLCLWPLFFFLSTVDAALLFGLALGLSLLGALLGITARVLARHDLARMRKGLINPDGEWELQFGQRRGAVCLGLGLCSVLLWGGMALMGWLTSGPP